MSHYESVAKSLEWLRDNHGHIWYHPQLTVGQKAGFLAASCHPTRCFLATLALWDRISHIEQGLTQMGHR